ncbi:MAG: hypothetical protein QOJ33_1501 [Chloroflexota bacterium]|jgi:hypothetical protein|nr:hypothetical protein [Chloroflexota bacterium]MEA2668567.1 hypothetical protein [Chloroflexota bacterium]
MEPPDFLKRIVDFSRLMEGENRDNYDAHDIAHWRAVYTDLIQFKEGLLGETSDHIRKVPESQKELGGVDIPFLQAEMERLRRGLAFWESAQAKG